MQILQMTEKFTEKRKINRINFSNFFEDIYHRHVHHGELRIEILIEIVHLLKIWHVLHHLSHPRHVHYVRRH